MFDQMMSFVAAMGAQTGLAQIWWGNVVMIAIGIAMILLGAYFLVILGLMGWS